MRFGDTLQAAIYSPWKEHYIDYAKLKHLLRETDDGSDAEADSTTSKKVGDQKESEEERGWTEHDESTFVHELINVQLEKVHDFQVEMSKALKDRTAACEARLEKLVSAEEAAQDKGKDKDDGSGGEESEVKPETEKLSTEETQAELKDALKELDDITSLINQLQKFSRINFTGFFKAAKKHDRRTRGKMVKSKGKKRTKEEGGLMVRPLLQVRLGALEFNKEDYNPLLYRLSAMYAFISQMLDTHDSETASNQGKLGISTQPSSTGKYSSYKFWIHPDNFLEVKTAIVRRLPMLIYNPNHAKQIDAHLGDPTINSLYFDSPKFGLYTDKVEKKLGATSLRLRWYGQLSDKPEIYLERKTMQSTSISNAMADGLGVGTGNAEDFEGAIEERIVLKEKYVESFIKGEYSMEKTINRMKDRKDKTDEDVEKYDGLVKDVQALIKEHNLQPMLRAVYTRTAFQIPGDDRVRVSLDTNLALIREDALDAERPCRDPEDWHRKDIDDARMEFPFSSIRKGEIHRFPYALLEIKVRDTLPPRARQWINELMNSHLVREAPRFSKFVHGVSSLFEDYVNIFPFWLGEVDEDIRKDPKSAWKQEQEKKAKQAEQELAVSYKLSGFGKFGTPPRPGFASRPDRPGSVKSLKMDDEPDTKQKNGGTTVEEHEDPESDSNSDMTDEDRHDQSTGLLGLLPSFSTSRYGRRHRQKNDDVTLPPGVTKPDILLMHSTPVNVEPKVWLANQRTFIKWEHISVLLATLSLGLYNAAGEKNNIARALGVAYTVIALFTGIWGYWIYIERCKLIKNRSGKDFDKKLGPIIISISLSIALLLNFGFKYYAAMEKNKHHGEPHGNATATDVSDWFEGVPDPVETLERALGEL